MKIKVKITGSKVHDVGYRYFLMSNAIDMGLKGFQARNRLSGMDQEVIALIEGDEEAIADFKELLKSKKPEHAEVSNIAYEDFESDVMRAGEYAQVCSALQLNKAIPVLLDIRNDLKEMKGDIKEMKGDMKEMSGDIKEMKGDIKAVRKNTEAIPQVLEDLPGYTSNFRQMQSDIRAIKDRLGMS